MSTTQAETGITLRRPTVDDGAAVWTLVRTSPPLEPNTCYAYLLLCHHFADTCVVADRGGDIVGFCSAYRTPGDPATVFVWQIAVGESARGQGLAGKMLAELLNREACSQVKFLDTTVSPSNEPSRRLFHSLARKLNTQCEERPLFTPAHFGGQEHEEETLLHIGPFEPGSLQRD